MILLASELVVAIRSIRYSSNFSCEGFQPVDGKRQLRNLTCVFMEQLSTSDVEVSFDKVVTWRVFASQH